MRRAAAAFVVATVLAPFPAFAADEPPVNVDLSKDEKTKADEPPPDAPPPPPYKKSLVVESALGALAFFGQFGKVAQPAPWFRTQVGYEVFRWFMPLVELELGFSDTSVAQPPPRTRAFSMYAAGLGARFTARFGDRVGVFGQGSFGWMMADLPSNGLGIIGFRNAEIPNTYLSGRIGGEWYMIDRHLAVGLHLGFRLAQGFAKTGQTTDSPVAGDATIALRYAF